MTASKGTPQQLLRGRIRDYKVTRTTEDFFLSDFDRNATGLAAVAAAASGMAGIGAGLMSLSGDEEEADLVEFTLDGGERVQGFLWKSPFLEGGSAVRSHGCCHCDWACGKVRSPDADELMSERNDKVMIVSHVLRDARRIEWRFFRQIRATCIRLRI